MPDYKFNLLIESELGDTSHGISVVAVVVRGIHIATIEVQVVRVVRIIGRTRPVVAF